MWRGVAIYINNDINLNITTTQSIQPPCYQANAYNYYILFLLSQSQVITVYLTWNFFHATNFTFLTRVLHYIQKSVYSQHNLLIFACNIKNPRIQPDHLYTLSPSLTDFRLYYVLRIILTSIHVNLTWIYQANLELLTPAARPLRRYKPGIGDTWKWSSGELNANSF